MTMIDEVERDEDEISWDLDSWRHGSACKDTDPDLFFPVGSTGTAVEQIATAKSICDSCPVQLNCLSYALHTNQESGVWGGTTEDERRVIRRGIAADRIAARAAAHAS